MPLLNREIVSRRSHPLFWLSLGLWIVLLVAGLWPFNFCSRNHVHWLQNENGIHFERYAQAYSSISWTLNGRSNRNDHSFTIELWLRPARTHYPHFSPIISFYSGSSASDLSIAQSGPDLVIEGPFLDDNGLRSLRRFWMDDTCRISQRVFVTISSGPAGTLVYWRDSSPHINVYSHLTPALYSGRIVVGHSPRDNQPWSGDIFALAVYHRALGAQEIAGDYEQWLAGDLPLSYAEALYTFDARSGSIVHNHAGAGPDLVLPSHFRPLHPTVLGFPHPFKPSDVTDTVVNILGFIPFGFFVCAYLRANESSIPYAMALAILFGFATSVGIELLQVLLPSRDSSLLDVINNVVGTVIGSILEVRTHELCRCMILESRKFRNHLKRSS